MRGAEGHLRQRIVGVLCWLVAGLVLAVVWGGPALALKAISVTPDQERIEITSLGEFYDSRGDSLQLEMAAASDAVSGRMTVSAATPGTNPSWIAFAVQNATDKPIERWLTAERYTMFGSGAIWPDLDARRLEAVTPSLGYVPERIKNDRADIFRITVEPGQTITFVAEMSTDRFARVYLWKPIDYELKVRDRQLFNGVLLGLTGLLAIFLTAVFAANHKAIFPTAALVAWCVLAHLTVDFGFFHKLFQLRPEDNAVYRAATESAIAAAFVIFLHTFLRLGQSPSLVRMLLGLWIAGQLGLVAIAVIDPRLASTFARLSFIAVGAVGALTTAFLALRGQDRALSLVPTWLLFLVWVFGAAVIITGRLASDVAASGLIAGLVLIVVLIGFTVTQFAFRSLEPVYGRSAPSEHQLSSLAVDGAGAGIFEWHPRRGDISVSSVIEGLLGLSGGDLSGKLPDFLKQVHESDRERVRVVLASAQDRAGATMRCEFRLRQADNSSRWFELDAASVPGSDARAHRYVGLMRDITDGKRARERLVQDAVQCCLTGLPNRALFLDRLSVVMARARTDEALRPSILLIDIDKFNAINASLGLPVGDGLLLTIARRLQRHVTARETLARVGGDQFAILIEDERDLAEFAREAERIRRAVRAPIKISGQDIVITGSIGIAIFDGEETGGVDLLEEAEIAMYRAKQSGADKIELFRPDMRADKAERGAIEAELRRAVEQNQLRVLYQPVIYLPTEQLAGFEAIVSWQHPKLGLINPTDYVQTGSDHQLIAKVGSYVLARATQDAARWQKELPRVDRPLFVSINIANVDLFRAELAREVRQILDHGIIPKGTLRLEIAESVVMENPEQATELLELLRGVGADLSLDEFGAGFSSLAYLQKFPFDTIKIDRAFVHAAGGGDAPEAAVVRSMVALSHELNKKVVADGVEDPEDAAFLRGIGCAYAQGFYYGDPMPDREVLQLLRLVRKSEQKLQPRGLMRMTMKRSKRKADGAATAGQPAAKSANGAGGDAPPTTGVAKPVRGKRMRPQADTLDQNNPANAEPTAPAHTAAYAYQSPPMPPASGEHLAVPPLEGYPPQPYRDPYSAEIGGQPMGYASADLEPSPLSSLQAGLDMLNHRAEAAEPAPFAPAPQHHWEQRQQLPPRGDDLGPVFRPTTGVAPQPALHGDALAALAKAVASQSYAAASGNGAHPQQEYPATGAASGPPSGASPEQRAVPPRPEPIVRTRPVRSTPDLSKLPPGLAASLARLAAGSKPTAPGSGSGPGKPPRRPGGTS